MTLGTRAVRIRSPHAEARRASEVKPESLSQARYWDRVKSRYLAYGLCDRCAAQAAWGHQVGFSLIEPPCGGCVDLIDKLPVDAGHDWRKLEGKAA